MAEANLVEIFSSVQGEGPYVGERTLFVRFGECDLRCRWCDSPHTWRPAVVCRIESAPGAGVFEERPNPVAVSEIVAAARALDLERHAFVSLTGGEPLLQPQAVREVAQALRLQGPRIHLETHGLATSGLQAVVDAIDVVSMDWKLASDVRRASDRRGRPVADFHAEHVAFLRVARQAPEVVVKVVVTPASRSEELDAMACAIASIDPATPVVVQPVTPSGPVREMPAARELLALVARLGERLERVRLIPQTHKLYGAP
jgi:7-carboxy-7-deazaguanine synthase